MHNFVVLKNVGTTGLALWRGPYFSGYCGAIRTEKGDPSRYEQVFLCPHAAGVVLGGVISDADGVSIAYGNPAAP